MFNELCRVGALLTLQLTPPSGVGGAGEQREARTRPWDWRLPTWHWLYNEARVLLRAPGAPPRRLLHIATDGGDVPPPDADAAAQQAPRATRRDAELLAPRKRALVDFTRAHVLGGGEGGAGTSAYKPPRFGF
jgi:hypothetical protein